MYDNFAEYLSHISNIGWHQSIFSEYEKVIQTPWEAERGSRTTMFSIQTILNLTYPKTHSRV